MFGSITHTRAFVIGLSLFGTILLSSCSSDSPSAPSGPSAVSGNVSKGPIAGSNVNIHQIDLPGTVGAYVAGPYVTDASGNWSGQIPAGVGGPYVFIVTDGSYVDEATSSTITLSAATEWYGILQGATSQVTPLTHTTFLAMQTLVNKGASINTALLQATQSSITAFGFSFTTTTPSDAAAAGSTEKAYAGLLGGLSELTDANAALAAFASTPKDQLITAVATDLVDGRLDGLDGAGNPIQVPTDATGTTTLPLPALSAPDISAWLIATNAYCASVTSLNGVSYSPTLPWNPSDVQSDDEVTFSGAGALLLESTMFVPSSSVIISGTQHRWEDADDHVQILTVPNSPTSVQTLYVTYLYLGTSYVWTVTNFSGVPGVTRSNGFTYFDDVILSAISGTMTTIQLNGSLEEPTGP